MTGRLSLVGVVVAVALGAASVSLGQATPPACSAAVMGKPVFSAVDLDEKLSSRLVATHTIRVRADLSDTVLDSGVTFALPSGVAVVRPHGEINAAPDGVILVAAKAGQVPVAATWTQDDQNGRACRGSASRAFRLQPATRMPRLRNVLAEEHQHPSLRFGLDWRFGVNLGRQPDLDPVTVMARGVRQARLPGARVPFKRITVPMRVGDPRFNDAKQYRVDVPRWRVTTGGDRSAFYVIGDENGIPSPTNVPLGYEVKVIQSGRLIAHIRLAGQCNSLNCDMRTIKVQLN